MTTNFFDDLERQLVAATPQRATRLRRARVRRTAALSTILLALLAGGAGIAAAVGGGTGDGSDDPGAPAGATTTTTTAVPLAAKPRATLFRNTVAILNTTQVPGLARGVAIRLQNAKVKIGNVTNAAEQTRASTCVTYVPGHEDAARRVATLLDLSPSVISPATKADRTIAGEEAIVIVLVGSDQNVTPKHTSRTTKSP
jgi:hypothetical protein